MNNNPALGIYLYMPRFVIAMVLLLTAGGALNAQTASGGIQLEIKDPSGAGMRASGRLRDLASGVERKFETDAQGKFSYQSLPFGRYLLLVSQAGFATQSELIEVSAAGTVTQAVTMTLGALRNQVDVVSTAPLPGVDRSLEEIPSPVQASDQRDISNSGALDLSSFMNLRLSGVHLNELQGNPFQADLNYRGYTASPLLGTPQGLSIYMDGVRLNQPFGDVVSWDLMPRIVIAETTLIPGSNPLFGLNTLGGAISLQTKDGLRAPGTSLQLSGGAYGRKMADFEHGGSAKNGLNWYLASSFFFEDGWRTASPSNVRQFFGKLGHQGEKTQIGLSVSYANNALQGNGLQEQRFLARDYSSVYTLPDITANRSPFLNFTARHGINSKTTFSGNAYYRYIRTSTANGDLNSGSLDQSVYQPSAADRTALTAAGYTGFPVSGATAQNTPFPFWRCIAQALQRDEPGEKCNGLITRSHSRQHNYGFSGQVNRLDGDASRRSQFTAGTAFDRSTTGFDQLAELGYLNADRSITGVKAFGDGVTGGDVDGAPFDTRVNLDGTNRTWSLYATDTLSLGNNAHLTFSGRYNRTSINNRDQIRPAGPGSLTGNHSFGRFNPSVGFTFNPISVLNVYGSYSEGNRAPTSIELGCADPAVPCRLPNAMAGDPPLKQVVVRTIEAGVRGRLESKINWSAGWFFAQNQNDILFVASGQTGFGYFKNFGETRRTGFQVDGNTRIGRVSFGGGYTFLNATYQSPEEVIGSSNSTSSAAAPGLDGEIDIKPGNRIPLIPQNMLKAFADVQVTSKLLVDVSAIGLSGAYARGNENNLHQPDGRIFLGSGKTDGYGLLNLSGHYDFNRRVQLFAQVNNVLDRHYNTAAQLGPTGLTNAGTFIARPFTAVNGSFPLQRDTFYAPGAPRMAWGGVRIQF